MLEVRISRIVIVLTREKGFGEFRRVNVGERAVKDIISVQSREIVLLDSLCLSVPSSETEVQTANARLSIVDYNDLN